MDGEFAKMSEATMLLLHAPEAVDAHGHDRDIEILGEKADAGLKGDHVWSSAVVDDAFRKDEDVVAAVGGFSCEAETFAKAGELGERKDVEESNQEEIAELPEPALDEKPLTGRMTKGLQIFAAHRRGKAIAEPGWQSIEDQADVGPPGIVIADKKCWALEVREIISPADPRVGEEECDRPGDCVVDEEAKEASGASLTPAGICEIGPMCGGLTE